LVIVEEDMVAQGFGKMSLAEYVDLVLSMIEVDFPDLQLVSREQRQTAQGIPVEILTFTAQRGFFNANRLVYLHEDTVAFNATYLARKDRYEELELMIDYSFNTFSPEKAGRQIQEPLAGDLKQIIAAYTQAIKSSPDNIKAYAKRGLAYYVSGELENALQDYNRVIELDPLNSSAYYHRGQVHYDSGDLAAAAADFTKAIELDPGQAGAYHYRGRIFYSHNELAQAIADYNQAIELEPDDLEVYLDRGDAYYRSFVSAYLNQEATYTNSRDLREALADFEWYLMFAPPDAPDQERVLALIEELRSELTLSDSLEALLDQRRIEAQLFELEQAVADYTRAITADPDDAEIYYKRGVAYAGLGDHRRAVADYTSALEVSPDLIEAYVKRAEAYSGLGDQEQAIADYTRAIELAPNHSLAYAQRGQAYYDLAQHEQALSDFTSAIELDPANPDFVSPYLSRGWLYYLLENYERALADFNQVIELSPTLQVYLMRAVVYGTSGQAEQATRDFELAIAQYEGEPVDAYNYMAWVLAHDLDTHYEAALAYAQDSVALESRADNHDTLALVYYKLEQYEAALSHYDQALALDAEQTLSYKGRGDVYLALGNIEAALADYQTYMVLLPPGPERVRVEQKIKSLK
jgi:tetratricopeptide (TPR) repeat protein